MRKPTLRRTLTGGALALTAALAGGGTAVALLAGSPAASATATAAVPSSATAAPRVPPTVGGPLGQLARDGTITETQATAVENALYQYMFEHMGETWSTGAYGPQRVWTAALAPLVTNGTITESQATAITKAMASWAFTYCWGRGGANGSGWSIMPGAGWSMMGGAGWSTRPSGPSSWGGTGFSMM